MKKTFLLALLAGLCIGLGGTIYLSVENKIVGSLLFGIGLLTILAFGFNLFTGKVGYALENKPSYIITLLIIWLGNLSGTGLFAALIRFTRAYTSMEDKVKGIVEVKLNDNLLSILLLAIGCGMCMYIAVQAFKTQTGTIRCVYVILPVMVFILCGFEHCIANMFYFALAESFSLKTLGYLAVMTVGNSIGGLTIPFFTRIAESNKQ